MNEISSEPQSYSPVTSARIIGMIVALAETGILDTEEFTCNEVDDDVKRVLRNPDMWELVWDSTPKEYSANSIGIPYDPLSNAGMPMAVRDGVDPEQVKHVWHALCAVEEYDSRLVIEFLEMQDGTLVPNQNVGD